MRRLRKVKILATLGPSSNDEKTIEELSRAGADVFRINMSHTKHDGLKQMVETIRRVEKTVGRPIGILADLQGPKLRVGTFNSDEIELEVGDHFTFDCLDKPGNRTRVYLPHPEIFESVRPGNRLLLDDGKVEMRCIESSGKEIVAEVVVPGTLSNRKGISLPDTLLGVRAITDKDRADLEAALENDVDWIALSFVQRPEDVIEVQQTVGSRAGVLAKIEKPQAVEKLEEIIANADAIMIARGDLGVEMPLEEVPGLQKRMIRMARKRGKPVVVATQMLESMINSPVPTRAEVSDVATAVYEGADAIMLSAESAAGEHPVQAVSTMNRIAIAVEQDDLFTSIIRAQQTEPEATSADAISAATRQVAETLDLAAIVTFTSSGSTGLRASRERPSKPIIALSPVMGTMRRLTLAWGLHCVQTEDEGNLDAMVDRACVIARQEGIAKVGDRIAITAGVPLGRPGTTNMLRIAFVEEQGARKK
ncbi:pyruvate kinase [Cucumibacter marinus]|uniref:pyruvate kinase n=1 Tax=Cucumibacter marinus TaxID=1121252 RepID=UPI0003FE547A|nr:pyruvate kinase [Cucumibacter marinus]